jgi:F0F1-type ATP synthase membrane subunit b/b'
MARITIQSLQADLQAAQTRITSLEQEVKSAQQYKKWAEEARDEARQELEDAHTLLDTLGSPLERTTKLEYNERKNGLHLRIASWLVKKAGL